MKIRTTSLRAILIGASSAIAMGTAALAGEATFEVAPGDLEDALSAYISQSGEQIIYRVDEVRGVKTEGVSGRLESEEALGILLNSTGFDARWDRDGGAAIFKTSLLTGAPMLVTGASGAVVQDDGGSQQDKAAEDDSPDIIIVQGEKIGRSLRETPASIVVIGEEADVARNRLLRDALRGIGNVIVENSNSRMLTVRGIEGSAGQTGGASFSTGAQPRVNMIVDGVPRPLTISAMPTNVSVWDLDRIEVARGPQSTLGGRNSLGGSIRAFTKNPSFEFEGAARVTYFSEAGTIGGAVMANAPLVEDQIAIRLTAEVSDGQSFIDVTDPFVAGFRDDIEDEEYRRYRGKILFTPAGVEGLEVLLGVDRSESLALFSNLVDSGQDDFVSSNFSSFNSQDDNEATVYWGEIRYDITDRIEFESRTALLDNVFRIPNVGSLFDLRQDTETLFTESYVRFRDFGFIDKAVIGVAHENQKDVGVNDVAFFPLALDAEIRNTGIFGEVELKISEDLAFIAGGRVEFDSRDRFIEAFGISAEENVENTAFIPKAGLRYDVSDDVVVGYAYSDGYRPGGVDYDLFNPAAGISIYGSERLRQHEVYTRLNAADDRFTLNGSAFYYTFIDAQIAGVTSGFLFGNVPQARGYGLEFEAAYQVRDDLSLTASLGLLDTEITDAGTAVFVTEGGELPFAANVTASGGLNYVSEFGFDASIQANYVGEKPAFSAGPDIVDGYVLVELNAGYDFMVGRTSMRISGFISNLLDNRFVIDPFFDPSTEEVGRPRTFGASATARF